MTLGPHRIADFELSEGHIIADRYELGGKLGSGAETVVFRARDFLSGQAVAVKLFRPAAVSNPAALKSFKRDLAVLRDDNHPNIVRVFDFGESAGTFYVAMELVGGGGLSRQAGDAAGWSLGTVLDVLEQVMNALAWLHSRGVVHGDIRSSNIVWNDGAVKLMDFGAQRDSRQATLPAPDSSCPYASPERLLGRPLTVASDLYSAAAVIYELLAGEPPHPKASLAQRAMAEAPRLRSRAAHIPEELAALLERCLNPDPVLRPAGAVEVGEACRPLRGRADARRVASQKAVPVLADRIGAQPLDISEMSTLLLTICRSLRGIHDAGMAHPDLAPRNIRLNEDGNVDIPSLPAPPSNETLMLTELKYAAPESLLTHSAIDGTAHLRSDIYVLGFVAYEALAGASAFRRQLFEDPDEPETDLFWMKWHADPSARLQALSDVNPSVPPELSTLIQRMIEKDPEARLGSLDEVESALTRFQRRLDSTDDIELASLLRPAPAPSPAAKGRKRKRKVLPLALLTACLLICSGTAWWLWQAGNLSYPELAEAWRWTEQKLAWARAAAGESLRPPPSRPSAPVLASNIETATGAMVLVPAGNFVMGSSAVPNEAPARTVHLPAFYIDKYEVTNARYRAFTDTTGYFQPSAPSWDPDYFAKSAHPVLNISWRDAQAFCTAAGKRLPTEAEWEKAARGSSPASRFWANWTVIGVANLKPEGSSAPAPIGAFSVDVSPFGAYDMAGNVHEWVNDQYGLYSGNPASLDGGTITKVVRGGSFALAPPELSPSWRASLDPVVAPGSDSPVGFRCAADPKPAITHPRGQSRP